MPLPPSCYPAARHATRGVHSRRRSPQPGAVAQHSHPSQDAPAQGGAVRGCGRAGGAQDWQDFRRCWGQAAPMPCQFCPAAATEPQRKRWTIRRSPGAPPGLGRARPRHPATRRRLRPCCSGNPLACHHNLRVDEGAPAVLQVKAYSVVVLGGTAHSTHIRVPGDKGGGGRGQRWGGVGYGREGRWGGTRRRDALPGGCCLVSDLRTHFPLESCKTSLVGSSQVSRRGHARPDRATPPCSKLAWQPTPSPARRCGAAIADQLPPIRLEQAALDGAEVSSRRRETGRVKADAAGQQGGWEEQQTHAGGRGGALVGQLETHDRQRVRKSSSYALVYLLRHVITLPCVGRKLHHKSVLANLLGC